MASGIYSDGIPPQQAALLADCHARVHVARAALHAAIDAGSYRDAAMRALDVADELRIEDVSPRAYYELHVTVCDALSEFATLLRDDSHELENGPQLLDLYELVQYSPLVIPRLYAMICIAGAYLATSTTAAADSDSQKTPVSPSSNTANAIALDLFGMVRAVQHPLRALFLRHYLLTTLRDHLHLMPDPVSLLLTSFVEMNRLWVRMSYVGPVVDPELRKRERKELKTLVGANILRLSVLLDSDEPIKRPSLSVSKIIADNSLELKGVSLGLENVIISALDSPSSLGSQSGINSTQPSAQSYQTIVSASPIDPTVISPAKDEPEANSEKKEHENEEKEKHLDSKILHDGHETAETSEKKKVDDPTSASAESANLQTYVTFVLPAILSQVLSCGDPLAQEYILDIVIHGFSEAYLVRTIDLILAASPHLDASVSLASLIHAVIERLRPTIMAATRLQVKRAAAKTAQKAAEAASLSTQFSKFPFMRQNITEITHSLIVEPNEEESREKGDKKENDAELTFISESEAAEIVPRLWQSVRHAVTTRSQVYPDDISTLLLSLLRLINVAVPDNLAFSVEVLTFCASIAHLLLPSGPYSTKQDADRAARALDQVDNILKECVLGRDVIALCMYPNAAQAICSLLRALPYSKRASFAKTLVNELVERGIPVISEDTLSVFFDILQVFIHDQRDSPYLAAAFARSSLGHQQDAPGSQQYVFEIGNMSRAAKFALPPHLEDELCSEQYALCRFLYLIHNDVPLVHTNLLSYARRALSEGGPHRLVHTYPALQQQALRLIRRLTKQIESIADCKENEKTEEVARLRGLVTVNFKFVHFLCTSIQQRSDGHELAARMMLETAAVADYVNHAGACYEFFVAALGAYEAGISDSDEQVNFLRTLVNNLLESRRTVTAETHLTIASKCCLHAARLLRRTDQMRTMLACAQLYGPSAQPGVQDPERVRECFDRASSFAEVCMDQMLAFELEVEILAALVNLHEQGFVFPGTQRLNHHLDHAASNLSALRDSLPFAPNQGSISPTMLALDESNPGAMLMALPGAHYVVPQLDVCVVAPGTKDGPATPLAAVTAHFASVIGLVIGYKLAKNPIFQDIHVPTF